MDKKIIIGAISGSLRKNSVNSFILQNLASVNESMIQVMHFNALDKLPFFNPDENPDKENSVITFQSFVRTADAIVICTPEYAFGMPGVLKNALDLLVSSGVLYQKPVGTISASPGPSGGDQAHASLRLTLTALGTTPIDGCHLTVPAVKQKIDATGEIVKDDLKMQLDDFVKSIIEYFEK